MSARGGIHVRGGDRMRVVRAVADALEEEGLTRGEGGEEAVRVAIAPARAGWVSVYPEAPARARALASQLAARLEAPALLVTSSDEAVVAYAAFDARGELADEYHSCPDWSKDVDEADAEAAELERTRGDAAALVQALGLGQAESLGQLLAAARVERLADHEGPPLEAAPLLAKLSAALGLPELSDGYEEVVLAGEDGELDLARLSYVPPARRGWLGRRA